MRAEGSEGKVIPGLILYITNHFTHPLLEAQGASPRYHLARILMERGQRMIVYCPVGRHVGSLAKDFVANLVPRKRITRKTTFLFPPMFKFPGGAGSVLALVTGSMFLVAYLGLTRTKPVVQYGTTILVSVVGRLVKTITGAPLVANYGDPDYAREKGLSRTFFRLCEHYVASASGADCVIYVDEVVERHISLNLAPKKTLFLPNGGYQIGCSPQDQMSDRAKVLRKALGLQSSKVIMYAGQIEPYYRLDVLALAAPEVIAEFPDTKFMIVGDGATLPALRREVSALNLSDRFLFLGQIPYDRLGDYISIADVCVNLTNDWCMGTKVIMYMASRKPALLAGAWYSEYGRFLRNFDNCVLVPLQKQSVADGLIRLLKDDGLRKSVANGAWDTVRPYTWDYHADQTLGVFETSIRTKNSLRHRGSPSQRAS